ncbi:MAG: hypothetical protein HY735_04995 [Verrucomicrobia bacterium]|nr:hypothetical protein [Verrucomicrobiota bacterium]
MTERAFERYRTRRRRIRGYLGSELNIASAALTIGAKIAGHRWLCGYFLRLAAKSEVRGLQKLLQSLAAVQVVPCEKGPLFERELTALH